MDLNELKSAWNNFSSRDASSHQLDENAIRELLKTRTKNLVDTVERNIKIGFGILFLILLFLLGGNELISISMPEGYAIPSWLNWLDLFNVIVFGGTFIYFIVRYYSIRKNYSSISTLRDALNRIIKTLKIYKVLFNMALFFLLVVAVVEFITGMYAGAGISAETQGGRFADLNSQQLFWAILRGVAVLIFLVSLVFLLFRWGFNRLYGNHLQNLKATLKELDEIE
ncbi:MAG: hypothetical protein A2W90_00540 [Bacteroidetes bacterium GWF2_42_66]|nr:MAG: hypothetical protein A2W90_00540 [Bacteroidetes bacterium GWF2_42_66]HBL76542.1 hypothetical protein [Prolixibacteraceae bacterium]